MVMHSAACWLPGETRIWFTCRCNTGAHVAWQGVRHGPCNDARVDGHSPSHSMTTTPKPQ